VSALDLLRFSAGALRGHRLRTGLSLLGVAIGVASVILLTSLGEGARLFVMGEFASLGSNLAIVIPGKTETTGAAPFISTSPNDLTVEDTEALVRRIPRVRRAAPIAIGGAAVRAGDRSREVPVIGTTGEFLDIRNLTMAVGRFLPAGEAGEESRACVIGSMVQSELFEGRNPLGKTLRIGEYRFRVVGVLGSRGESIGMNVDDMVYIPVETAMRMFNTTSLFRIIAEVNAYSEMDLAKREILAVLRERHGGEEDVTVFTQDSVLSSFGNILRMLTAALAGIAAVSLAVAGIGIMNVMLVTVVERTREIGLLKALGVGRGQILSVFLVESALISLSGGVAGLGAALGITAVARHAFPEFPVQAPVWAVAAALGVSILVGVLFGAMPARRAARLDPIAALARR
jgi:putative ABC transport system permease protein